MYVEIPLKLGTPPKGTRDRRRLLPAYRNDPETTRFLTEANKVTDLALDRPRAILAKNIGKLNLPSLLSEIDVKAEFVRKCDTATTAYRKVMARSIHELELGPLKHKQRFHIECMVLGTSVLYSARA